MLQGALINKIKFKGSPVQLVGRKMRLKSPVPDFVLVNNSMEEVGLAKFAGKIKLITTLASLDTPTCESQAKEFNQEAAKISSNLVVIVVSKDLPFAQSRFCLTHAIKNLVVLSDYKYSSFGLNYGLLIKELNLLARAAIILDANNMLRYLQVGEELTEPLDYRDVFNNLREIAKSNPLVRDKNLGEKCQPCAGGQFVLPIEAIKGRLASLPNWQLVDSQKIWREFEFTSFRDAKYFVDVLALIAEEQGHHPNLALNYNKLKVELTTHTAGGLTESDLSMAQIIEEVRG